MADGPDDEGASRPQRPGEEPPIDFGIDDLVAALQKVPARAPADAEPSTTHADAIDELDDVDEFDDELEAGFDDIEPELESDPDDDPFVEPPTRLVHEFDAVLEPGFDGDVDAELDPDGEVLDDVVEPTEDPTHPRRLYLVVGDAVHEVVQERYVIGRVSSQCDLVIVDANVSRQHCAIERRDGMYFACDLGSTNGIEVDGNKVDDHPIAEGDVLVLSGHRIVCTFEAPPIEVTTIEMMPTDPAAAVMQPEAPARRPASVAGPTTRLPSVEASVAATIVVGEVPRPASGATAVAPVPTPDPAPAPAPVAAALDVGPRHMVVGASGDAQARIEQRIDALAQEIAALRAGLDRMVRHVESLEGIDALARLIQRRLQQAKRG